METITTLTGVPTQDLKAGDIVHAHGMRVRLDTLCTYHGGHWFSHSGRWGKCSQGNAEEFGDACCVVYSWSGTVLNRDEVKEAGIVPIRWLRTSDGRDDQWTIQGNFRAAWTIEVDLGELQLAGD